MAFDRASAALSCAIALRQALFPMRMALHTGEAEPGLGEYPGRVLEHAERILAVALEGQALCSLQTALLLPSDQEPGVRLVRLGLRPLPGAPAPEPLFEIETRGSS
jgi:hypothetical protein